MAVVAEAVIRARFMVLLGDLIMADKTNGHWIYRPYITLKSGKRIYAAWYGLKAFRIWVED